MTRFRFTFLAIVCVFGFALTFVGTTAKRIVHAQDNNGDTWSEHDERLATVSTSISSSTALISAITGKRVNVRAITIESDTSGVVAFQDGSSGTTIMNLYLVANTPYQIYEGFFGPGVKTTRGTGLYAALGSATLTATIRYRAE